MQCHTKDQSYAGTTYQPLRLSSMFPTRSKPSFQIIVRFHARLWVVYERERLFDFCNWLAFILFVRANETHCTKCLILAYGGLDHSMKRILNRCGCTVADLSGFVFYFFICLKLRICGRKLPINLFSYDGSNRWAAVQDPVTQSRPWGQLLLETKPPASTSHRDPF